MPLTLLEQELQAIRADQQIMARVVEAMAPKIDDLHDRETPAALRRITRTTRITAAALAVNVALSLLQLMR